MDDTQLFDFDSPLNQSSYIKVIGVGGGGGNAVNHMFRKGIAGVDFIISNTDMKALNSSPVPNKLVLGHEGLGVGGRPERAKRAAEEKEQEIRELFQHNTKMVFITAGMGGGTGTGAAPVIAKIAKSIKVESLDDDESDGSILVVAVVTTPFQFEGNRRVSQALKGVEELRDVVDTILVINNEKLRSYGNLAMSDAFAMANDVLFTAVRGIAEIITLNAYVNIDFRDVNTTMANSGTALMGIGEGEGERRAVQAVEQATTSVLLNDSDIEGAKNVLLYFSYGPEHELTMDEMSAVTDYISDKTGSPDTNVIWGAGFDESLGDKVKITLIATGFKQSETNVDDKTDSKTPEVPSTPDVPQNVTPVAPKVEPATAPVTTPIAPVVNVAPEQPVASVQPQPQTQPRVETPAQPANSGRIVHVLEVDEEDDVYKPKAAPAPKAVEPDDDGFVLKSATPAATAPVTTSTVATAPVAAPVRIAEDFPTAQTPTRSDQLTMDRSARIQRINQMLHNTPNGPAILERMNPADLTGEDIFATVPSSESEAPTKLVNKDGSLRPNPGVLLMPD